jgi:pseudouridine-5'-monophosphatase
MTQKITHVIFDLDGLLLDTESVFSAINVKLLAKYDKVLTPELEHKLMGTRTDEAVKILLHETALAHKLSPDEYLTLFQAELEHELPKIKEMPGSTKLIDYFHQKQIPLAICTGSNADEFAEKTVNFQEWLQKIPMQVTGNQFAHCKPNPEPYLLTMRRFECQPVNPTNCLVFEDAISESP